MERYTTLDGGNTSVEGFSCVPEARVRIPAGLEGEKRNELWMKRGLKGEGKRESPRGPNLHPAKQPRTTLFDWLPAGLPSTPAPKYIPVFLLHSFIRLPSSPHRRLSPSPSTLFSFFLFYYILSSSFLTFLSSLLFVISRMGACLQFYFGNGIKYCPLSPFL